VKTIGIQGRLLLFGILGLLGIVALGTIAILTMRGQMIDDRVAKVKSLTELSLGIIQGQYDRVQRGELTEDQAKAAVIQLIRPLRYDHDGYVFIDDWDCNSVMLPIRPEFEGRSFLDVKDANGDLFVRNQRDTAIAGGGAVYYSFVKPKSDQAAPKVAYVLPFAPWRWFVATGVYLDDVDQEVQSVILRFLGLLLPAVTLIGGAIFLLSRSISHPLRQLTLVMTKLAHREFDTPIPETNRTDEIGDITRAVHVFRDNGKVNDELQQEIQRSNQELENFAYVASHDLREPLRMISSFATMLERSLGNTLTQDQRDYIGFVRDGAKRMNALILDMLELSRIGRTESMVERVDLGEVLGEARLNLSVAIAESGTEITVATPLPSLTCSPREMSRVFQNLLANAIRYRTPERPPHIEIRVDPVGKGWRFTVDDNGIGIPVDQSERIFQIFQRLHAKDAYGGGTGIGLAVCKKIVERHKGRIWVEPNPSGTGSRFCFTLGAL